MSQFVSGRYDSHANAMQAVWGLHAAGLPLRDIALVSLSMQPTSAPPRHALHPDAEAFDAQTWWAGFLEALLSRPLDPLTLRAYLDAVRSGKSLMLAHGTAKRVRSARQVLEESGASDIVMRVTIDIDCDNVPIHFPRLNFPLAGGSERRNL